MPLETSLDRVNREVLEHGDRVDAAEALVGGDPLREHAPDEPEPRERSREPGEIHRPPVAAVVWIDDRDVVPEPGEVVGDERLTGADLEQTHPPRNAADDCLEHPRALHVLHVAAGPRQGRQVVDGVAVIPDRRIAQPGQLPPAVQPRQLVHFVGSRRRAGRPAQHLLVEAAQLASATSAS